jgi:uncharacterized protein (TIGR03435 family)
MCWKGQDVTMTELAHFLEQPAARPVVDDTGLTGHYDFQIRLEWIRRRSDAGPASDSLPTVFTAVQEQLGLRLESATHSFPHLVIDSIDREPTEN